MAHGSFRLQRRSLLLLDMHPRGFDIHGGVGDGSVKAMPWDCGEGPRETAGKHEQKHGADYEQQPAHVRLFPSEGITRLLKRRELEVLLPAHAVAARSTRRKGAKKEDRFGGQCAALQVQVVGV
eukprot:CAMPEP_0185795324 /NCGR_PEP_ID=MMETSP1174-20130828/160487_1 /TAXON_ID=35687 /ORGANISM="Dictyocha speculum, Strain CCMP1381" /LENGTH=123 /DNA_ID=CAMNT_0028490615 /DNA_START=250 /DNA_END=621 /DNA_ORIENTATION=+